MPGVELKLYGPPESHAGFLEVMERFPWLLFWQPNAERAPWHVQTIVQHPSGYKTLINFWPHKNKAQVEGEYSISGTKEIIARIEAVFQEDPAEIDLIED